MLFRSKASKLRGQGDGVVIDGTGAVGVQFQGMAREFKDAGYDVQIVFVESSLETALERNKNRSERRLTDATVRNSIESAKKNKKAFKEMVTFFPYSAKGFVEINTDNLKQGESLPTEFVKEMDDFTKGYIKDRINAEDFALRGADLLAQGAEYDFSEFNKVVDGTPGPLLDKAKERAKKFGNENMFILTARPAESAGPIREFLKSQGLDIPLENITGLGNSTGEAKALWMLDKFAEGYNDMYFVDDALPNVDAVKNVLDQLDIKSDVQIAKRSANPKRELNLMLERSKGVDANETFNRVKAKNKGEQNRKRQIFIPPSAEDFQGLMYYNMGKGAQGEADAEMFKKLFYNPYNRADKELDLYRQGIREEATAISKKLPNVRKKLRKDFAKTGYTVEQAMRIYLYDKNGHSVPGISEAEQKKIDDQKVIDDAKALADLKKQIRDAEAVTEDEQRALEIIKVTEHYDKLIELAKAKGLSTVALEKAKTNALSGFNEEVATNEIKWEELTQKEKGKIISDGFNNMASVLGEQTAAGKAAAIAAATISTYQSAQDSYKSLAGIPIIGPALGAAAAAAAIVSGIGQVKKITSTPVPTLGGKGAPTIGAGTSPQPAPAPTPPAFNVVGQGATSQLASVIGEQTQEPVRAYVVSNDVTTAQGLERNIVEGIGRAHV